MLCGIGLQVGMEPLSSLGIDFVKVFTLWPYWLGGCRENLVDFAETRKGIRLAFSLLPG